MQIRPVTRIAVIATLIIGFIHSAPAEIIAGPIINPANNSTYYLLGENSWTISQVEAMSSLSGNLVTINDAAEGTWVYSTFSNFDGVERDLWIGLHDPDSINNSVDPSIRETEFEWISGEPVTYSNWAVGQPNTPSPTNSDLFAHYVSPIGFGAGQWNNTFDKTPGSPVPIHGVVEIPVTIPEPASAVLFITCAFAFVFVAYRRLQLDV